MGDTGLTGDFGRNPRGHNMQRRITKALCETVPPGTTTWDTEMRGFGVRATDTCGFFVLRYRHGGRRRLMTLGRVGEITVTRARRFAAAARGELAAGRDPLENRRAAEQAARLATAEPTLTEFSSLYIQKHARPHKKPSTIRRDEELLRARIIPRLGKRKVAAITQADVKRLHADMHKTPVRANRVLALLSNLLAQAEIWGYRAQGTNPCKGLKRYEESKRERFLSPAEVALLWQTLDAYEQTGARDAVQAIRLLVLTGCRKGEIVGLHWDEVDLDNRALRLADSKTGARTVPLASNALAILQQRARERRSDWVFPARTYDRPRTEIDSAWRRIRRTAKLTDLRLHDLRHSFAAAGIHAGLSLPEIGKLLGHKAAATTQRYAHVADEVARRAADAVGDHMATAIRTGKPKLHAVK